MDQSLLETMRRLRLSIYAASSEGPTHIFAPDGVTKKMEKGVYKHFTWDEWDQYCEENGLDPEP